MLSAAMVAAQAIPELFKLGTALKQKSMAKKYAKTPRPGYEIPQALKDYLAQTKFNASVSGLPGQSQLENKLQRQQASGIARSIQSQGSAAERDMAAAAGDYSTKQALEDTAYDAARFKVARQQDYYTAQQQMAKQQLAQWDWDKKQPYIDAMAATSALTQSANENTMAALEGLMGAVQTAGMAGLFGAGNSAGKRAGKQLGSIVGELGAGAAAGDLASNAKAPAAPATPNWAAGPLYGTDFDPTQMGYSFQDPNSRNYNYSSTQDGMGYDVYNSDTGQSVYAPMNKRAGAAISTVDPFISSLMQPRGINPVEPPDMQPTPSAPEPLTPPLYDDLSRRQVRRQIRQERRNEMKDLSLNLPGDITNNWANNYFGMEMPIAYGYGNTFNEILNRIGTQYGLGDMYGEEFNDRINRAYSRFNPFT